MRKMILGLFVLGISTLFAETSLTLQQALEKLYPFGEESFCLVEGEIGNQDVFSQLKIEKNISIRCVGDLEHLHNQLVEALNEIGNDQTDLVEAAAKELVELTYRVLEAEGYQNGIVMFRAFTPNQLFKIPRWHMDGNFFKPYGQNPPKFVITLKGPGTLFQPSNCQRDYLLNDLKQPEQDRQKVALRFSKEATIQTKTFEGAFFVVGNDHAAVHSEPSINEQRIFMSVMGATDEQVIEMRMKGF